MFSDWGQCKEQYFFSDDAGENAGAKCPCPDADSPCQSASGACLAKVNGACPTGSAVCTGRLLEVRSRARVIKSSIFLTDAACPELFVYDMCGSWASKVSGTSPVIEQPSQTQR